MKNLVEGADFILLPTTTQSRSIELTVEMARTINKYNIPYAALLVKVDSRKEAAAQKAKECLEGFDIKVLDSLIPLLSAFEQAETEGVTVDQAIDGHGRANPRRMAGWFAYCSACKEIEDLYDDHKKTESNPVTNRMGLHTHGTAYVGLILYLKLCIHH